MTPFTIPPKQWAEQFCSQRAHVQRGPSGFLCLSWREWPKLPFIARIERAHSYRARSASKKGTWPLSPHSSARACAIFPLYSQGHGLIGSPTAPVERAYSDRARSGSIWEPSAYDRTSMMMYQQPLIPDALETSRQPPSLHPLFPSCA